MGHGLERHHAMALGFLSLVRTLDPGTIADREVGRFDIRPGQIFVAVRSIALTFVRPVLCLGAAAGRFVLVRRLSLRPLL